MGWLLFKNSAGSGQKDGYKRSWPAPCKHAAFFSIVSGRYLLCVALGRERGGKLCRKSYTCVGQGLETEAERGGMIAGCMKKELRVYPSQYRFACI